MYIYKLHYGYYDLNWIKENHDQLNIFHIIEDNGEVLMVKKKNKMYLCIFVFHEFGKK